ncbi:MAG: RNA-binding protein [Pseudomonadota bacterium]
MEQEHKQRVMRARPRPAPVRTCIVTRTTHAPDAMIRFVCDPDGAVVPDLARKLPGRGVWVGCRAALVEKAVRSKAFAKAFRAPVTPPADLVDLIDRLLRKRAIEALSLANKAGAVVAGHTKVNAAIEAGRAAVLLQAVDAAPQTRARLFRKFEATNRDLERDGKSIDVLTISELSLALGRENVVHAALIDSRTTPLFAQAALRLMQYRSVTPLAVAQFDVQTGRGDAAESSQTRAVEKQD